MHMTVSQFCQYMGYAHLFVVSSFHNDPTVGNRLMTKYDPYLTAHCPVVYNFFGIHTITRKRTDVNEKNLMLCNYPDKVTANQYI